MSEQINLDAFNTSLTGSRILCIGPFNQSKYPPLHEAIKDIRSPPKKKIWVGRQITNLPLFPAIYDAQFAITDPAVDWVLVLTYLSHCTKPALLVIEDVSVPDAMWPRLRMGVTTIVFTSSPITASPYDAIFFAPVQDLNTQASYVNTIVGCLSNIFKQPSYQPKEYRDILQELRIANAGLVWTRVGETGTQGALYWYDAVPIQNSEQLSKKQLADLFIRLSQQFQ